MATEVIHEHGTTTSDNSGAGFAVGIIALILFVLLLFYLFGSGVFSRMGGGTNVQIPDKVDVNLNQGGAK